MSVESALASGRAFHLARMTDLWEIGVPTGARTYDPTEQVEVEVLDPLFAAPGYLAATSRAVSEVEVGGRTSHVEQQELRIPWDSPEVPANAVATCVEVGPSSPERLLGRRLRVSGSMGDGSQRTCYRLHVEEVLS